MKILFLPNWKVEFCDAPPADKQPPDYYVKGEPYWFFRYFEEQPEVDVIDISSFPFLERFEKYKIRFYILQALKAIPKLHKYDLVISHGMQSGVVVSLWRRLFRGRYRHIVFDIGSFNSAAESGGALKLMQFSSKSIDGIIYHTSSQKDYYARFFPWILPKASFVKFGTDSVFFGKDAAYEGKDAAYEDKDAAGSTPYCICVGYSKRDWDTLINAYKKAAPSNLKLRLVGHIDESYSDIPGVEMQDFVPVNELIDEIRGSLFGILPLKSFNYSYGQMTLMQQMALGKCVIASRVPSLIDYADDGETAVFYEPEDIDDLAKKISMVNSDAALRGRIGENAARYIKEDCNEKIMAREIERVIEEIC